MLRLIERKFSLASEAVRARIASADSATLRSWSAGIPSPTAWTRCCAEGPRQHILVTAPAWSRAPIKRIVHSAVSGGGAQSKRAVTVSFRAASTGRTAAVREGRESLG